MGKGNIFNVGFIGFLKLVGGIVRVLVFIISDLKVNVVYFLFSWGLGIRFMKVGFLKYYCDIVKIF